VPRSAERPGSESHGTVVSDERVEVSVNGKARSVPTGCTLAQLIGHLGVERRRVAVAVNRTVVPRADFDVHPLTAGDRVAILEAVGGG
jgi:sulfur carrier protein